MSANLNLSSEIFCQGNAVIVLRRNNLIMLKVLLGSLLFIFCCPSIFAGSAASDRVIASRFAPVFYQALGDKPRSDYITKFDFDGDWRGDNNWSNSGKKKYPLKAYIYYAVSETATHYFIHYAVFHPRDYKGGEVKGRLFSSLIRQGAEILGDKDPTGIADEATLAHENDMEGTLVVVAKNGGEMAAAKPAYVETLAHNVFIPYLEGASAESRFSPFQTDGQRVKLYIEPKGHGIEAYSGDAKQVDGKEFLVYKYTGRADDPDKVKGKEIGYDLLPIETTLWTKAKVSADPKGPTFGTAHNYAPVSIDILAADGKAATRKIDLPNLGSAFYGKQGGINMARPPWGWFDSKRREDPLGLWFFDPAKIIKRNFNLGEAFSTVYTRVPFWAAK